MLDNKHTGKDYLTFIAVVAAYSVLTLHTNSCYWRFSATERYWKTATVIECLYYFAVPHFFMISGITLMDFFDRYTLKEYFVKRIKKTVIPFLAWSMIGLIWNILLERISLSDINLKEIYQRITGTSIVSFYWFFPALFSVYLSVPLFAAVDPNKRKLVFSYLVATGFVFNILIPFLKSVFNSDLNNPLSVEVVSSNLIWIPLGWLLHSCELSKKQKTGIYLLALLGLLLHIIGSYVTSMSAGTISQIYKGSTNLPSFLYSVGTFVLFKDLGEKIMAGKLRNFFRMVGMYTFPIYLMQFILLEVAPTLPFVNFYSIIYRLGAPFIMIPILIAAAWCIRKIPVIRRILP